MELDPMTHDPSDPAIISALPISQLFHQLGSSAEGLTTVESSRRLAQYGPNVPAPPRRAGPLLQFLSFCTNPLVVILLIASVAAALVGESADAAIIASIVIVSVILNFVQAYRSERAVVRLREQVFARDRGVCAQCGLDTEALRKDKRKLDFAARRRFEKEWGRRRHLWDADHIVPVVEGGGECDLSNMRTLCLKCHRAATAALRGRLGGQNRELDAEPRSR